MIAVASAMVCVVVLGWFAMRARLGAAARRAGGTRLRSSDRLRELLAHVSMSYAGLGLLGGMTAGGPVLGVVACVGGLAWKPIAGAREARARSRLVEAQMPDVLRGIASALRAGRNVPQAIAAVRDESVEPARSCLECAVLRLAVGASLEDALAAFADAARCDAAREGASTLLIGRTAGARLPSILEIGADSLAERERIARDRRAATAQARLSAAIVASMPVAFYVLLGSAARQQLDVLIGDPAGWVLLGLGIVLEVGGVMWMRALLR